MRCHAPGSQVLGPVACEELYRIKPATRVGSVGHRRSCTNLKSVCVRHGRISCRYFCYRVNIIRIFGLRSTSKGQTLFQRDCGGHSHPLQCSQPRLKPLYVRCVSGHGVWQPVCHCYPGHTWPPLASVRFSSRVASFARALFRAWKGGSRLIPTRISPLARC